MADTAYNHGIRVFDAGQSPRPVELDNTTSIGMVFTAPDADADVFPLNSVVQCFSNDPATLAALGETGTGLDNFQAITDQGSSRESMLCGWPSRRARRRRPK